MGSVRVNSQRPVQIVPRLQSGKPQANHRCGVTEIIAAGHAAKVRQTGLAAFRNDGGEHQFPALVVKQLPDPPCHPLVRDQQHASVALRQFRQQHLQPKHQRLHHTGCLQTGTGGLQCTITLYMDGQATVGLMETSIQHGNLGIVCQLRYQLRGTTEDERPQRRVSPNSVK